MFKSKKMKNEFQQSQPFQLQAQYHFTSEFFTNFINDNSMERTHSNISNVSVEKYEFSVNQQKFKLFHAENLVNIWWTIHKRNTIHRWIINKQYIKKIEKRTPNYVTKMLLKVFYTIALKLQIKYTFAFRKLQRHYQENKRKITEANQQNEKKNKDIVLGLNLQKINAFLELLKNSSYCTELKQYFFNQMKQIYIGQEPYDPLMINQDYLQNYNEKWKINQHKNTLGHKIQILLGTLNLTIHPLMRQAFLTINIYKRTLETLEENNISQIKPQRKESFKMNHSIEAEFINKELFNQNQPHLQNNLELHIFSNSKEHYQQQNITEINESRKQEVLTTQFIEKNNPKHLKFSKDTKRKFLKQSEPISREFSQNFNSNSEAPIEKLMNKSQVEENSFTKRNSMINSSDYLSRSFVKKIYNPLETRQMKCYKNITILQQNDLPLELNQGEGNKWFQNSNNVTNVRQLKQLQLKKEFTDFNDLFFMKQMTSFYEDQKNRKSLVSNQSSKKSISLAKIKQKINKKTVQQYFQHHKKSSQKLFNDFMTERSIAGQPSIGKVFNKSRDSIKKRQNQSRNMDLERQKSHNPFSTHKKYSNNEQNRYLLRIPSKLPQYFDYYVDKSPKKSQLVGKQKFQMTYLGHSKPQMLKKRNTSISKSKKSLFNTVKSSTTRLSTEMAERSKKLGQSKSLLFSQHPKTRFQGKNIDKSKFHLQKRISKGGEQKRSSQNITKGEYYIAFRDPPKKKMKKHL